MMSYFPYYALLRYRTCLYSATQWAYHWKLYTSPSTIGPPCKPRPRFSVVNKKLQTLSMTFLLESVRLGRQRSIESFLEGIQRPEGGKKGLYVKNLCIAYSEPTNNKPTSLGVVSTKLSRIFLECKRLQVLDMRRFLRNIIGHKLDSAPSRTWPYVGNTYRQVLNT